MVVTRARGQKGSLFERLMELGAELIELPSIEIAPPSSFDGLDRAIREIRSYDWIVFTSANGVDAFLARLLGPLPAGLKIAAVGSSTAEALRRAGLAVNAIPAEFHAEALARALAAGGVAGKRFLVVRAEQGRELLPDELRRQGAQVELVAAYRTVKPVVDVGPMRRRLESGEVDCVAFASGSAVKNFVELLGSGAVELLKRTAVAAIGPTTAQAARELGLEVAIQPQSSTASALAEAIGAYFRSRPRGKPR